MFVSSWVCLRERGSVYGCFILLIRHLKQVGQEIPPVGHGTLGVSPASAGNKEPDLDILQTLETCPKLKS